MLVHALALLSVLAISLVRKSKDLSSLPYLIVFAGPVVNGYVVLRTEAHDDDGCPHTLEHLVRRFLSCDMAI
jgi:Zn-dependent M16 (insulinase) family peptidase